MCKFSRYITLLLESATETNEGAMSLDEEYPPIKTNAEELANTLKATAITVQQWEKPIISTVLAELNHNFAPLGITFEEKEDDMKSYNYPNSGIVQAECEQNSKLIYIYIDYKFLNFLVNTDIDDDVFTSVSEDLYSQILHEETHRHQFNQSKVKLNPDIPTRGDISSNRKYIQNIHEIDAFARQFASELNKDVHYSVAIKWLIKDSPELLNYKIYKSYRDLVGKEAMFSIQMKQKDSSVEFSEYQKKCIFTWNRFRQRTAWFLASLRRNHLSDSAPDISVTNELIEETLRTN